MTFGLMVALIGIPLFGGISLAVVRAPALSTRAGIVTRVLIAATLCCALALLPRAGQPSPLALSWLPGMGTMTLELGASGLVAASVTALAALLAYRQPCRRPAPSSALILIALAAANVALLAGHFLLRYAALEIVALAVALAPLAEMNSEAGAPATRKVYLLLRIGDAALLIAILILFAGSGTLEIDPALQKGETLPAPDLRWAAAGMALAVWVKLGGWPMHIWRQVGASLSPGSQSWLFGAVMPTLGLYLLYRVSPLLAHSALIATIAQWVGACTAVWAVFVALTQPDVRSGAIYVDAAMAGLVLLIGAGGLETAAWASILVLTPLRMVFYDTDRIAQRQVRAVLLIAGGSALALWAAMLTHWARAGGTRLDILFVAESAVALLGIWVISSTGRTLRASTEQVPLYAQGPGTSSSPSPSRKWIGAALACVWGAGTLGMLLLSETVRHTVEHITHSTLPVMTGILPLARHVVSSPAIWIVAALAVVLRLLRWRPHPTGGWKGVDYDIESGLTWVAGILNRAIEGGIHEQMISSSVQLVLSSAQFTLRVVEGQILEGAIRRLVRAVALGGKFTRQTIENEGLEGLLRRTVHALFATAHSMQAWHTGKLRYNLAWVVASLGLALLLALFVSPW